MAKNSETEIVNQILLTINMFPGVIARRVNTAGVWNEERHVHMKPGPMTAVGMSDILIRAKGYQGQKGIVIFLEVKTATGVLNDNQRQFAADCDKTGCIYEVARSRDDALAILRKYKIIGGEL